jgi:predicted RNase H-like nuclease
VLSEFLPGSGAKLKELKEAADFMDAAVAGYTLYLHRHGDAGSMVLGSREEGFILLPRSP